MDKRVFFGKEIRFFIPVCNKEISFWEEMLRQPFSHANLNMNNHSLNLQKVKNGSVKLS